MRRKANTFVRDSLNSPGGLENPLRGPNAVAISDLACEGWLPPGAFLSGGSLFAPVHPFR